MAKDYGRVDFRDQIAANKRKSFFLIVIIFLVFLALGYVIGMVYDPSLVFFIMIISIIVSITYVMISYYNSDKIALASVKAKKASREKYKQYYSIVEGLTVASGLPMPKLYVMESSQINAFASGRNPENAVICVTTGALERFDKYELEAVMAHELSHVANYDIRFMTLTAVMVGMIAIVSEIFLRSLWFGGSRDSKGNAAFLIIGIAMAILAPIVVWLVQMAISRKREYAADASAVKFTRYPQGLIKALKKIKYEHSPSSQEKHKVSKAVAPLFFANPFKNLGGTHPPIDKRIEILQKM
jgi:heat shock protein HtpX